MSDSLQPHGLHPIRLLCSWDFPGKNPEVGCHFLLRGIFWPWIKPMSLAAPELQGGRWILYRWATREARILYIHSCLLLLSSLFDITLSCCCCSVTKSCLNLCDLMACSTPGSSVLHYLLAFAQIHMHWVGDVNHLILCLFLLVLPSVFPRITLNFIYTHHLASTKCSFSA